MDMSQLRRRAEAAYDYEESTLARVPSGAATSRLVLVAADGR